MYFSLLILQGNKMYQNKLKKNYYIVIIIYVISVFFLLTNSQRDFMCDSYKNKIGYAH